MDWTAHYATPAGIRAWPCDELVRFVGGRHFDEILEVGCGAGGNLWFLAEHARDVVGVDLSPDALRLARDYMAQREVENAEVRVGDAAHLDFEPGRFDLVVDAMVSQHVPWDEHEALYREYRRVLRPGGQLFLYHLDAATKGNRGHHLGQVDWDGLVIFPEVGFFCLPSRAALERVVSTAGFAVRKTQGLAREYAGLDLVAHYTVLSAEAT